MPSLNLIIHPIISLPKVPNMVGLPPEFNDTKQKLMKVVRCHPQTGDSVKINIQSIEIPQFPSPLGSKSYICQVGTFLPLTLISPGKISQKYQYLRVSMPRRLPTNMLVTMSQESPASTKKDRRTKRKRKQPREKIQYKQQKKTPEKSTINTFSQIREHKPHKK